jgi:hypothetical protein
MNETFMRNKNNSEQNEGCGIIMGKSQLGYKFNMAKLNRRFRQCQPLTQ